MNSIHTLIFQSKTRTITQFHYTAWPDHGTPEELGLVQFHRAVTKKYQTGGLMLVHCRWLSGVILYLYVLNYFKMFCLLLSILNYFPSFLFILCLNSSLSLPLSLSLSLPLSLSFIHFLIVDNIHLMPLLV